MGIRKWPTNNIPEATNYDVITGEETIDVQEILVDKIQKTIWSSFSLETENETLKEFFDMLKVNNELMMLFKGMERYLITKGKAFLVFEIIGKGEEKVMKIFTAQNSSRNQSLRIFQQEQIAVAIEFETYRNNSFAQTVFQVRTPNETRSLPLQIPPMNVIQMDIWLIKAPEWVRKFSQYYTEKHNYGVMSALEIFNKDIIDRGADSEKRLIEDNAVSYLKNFINNTLTFYKKELIKNSTRFVGNFKSSSDAYGETEATNAYLGNKMSGSAMSQYLASNDPTKRKSILEDDYILVTRGAEATVDKMQSTLDGESIARAINQLIEFYMNGCGWDWEVQSQSGQSQYTSSSEISSQNKRSQETVKAKVIIREKQYTDFLNNAIDAWFQQPGKHKEFTDEWEFKILSNIITQENSNPEVLAIMLENGLISKEEAIRRANKYMSEAKLKQMIETIKTEQEEAEAKEEAALDKEASRAQGWGDEQE